jgi:hypothetical protein
MPTTTVKQSIHQENKVPIHSGSRLNPVATAHQRRNEHPVIRQQAVASSGQREASSPPAKRSRTDLPTRHIPTPQMQYTRLGQEQYQIAPARTFDQRGFNLSLPVLFLLSGYVVGAALVLIFGLDVLVGVPFSRVTLLPDIGFLFSGAALLYLSWNARDGCR